MTHLFFAKIQTRVAGIPCIIGVTHYQSVRGSYNRHADSDWDYHGYTECEFVVCDRRGRPAPWLQKKMTSTDESRIEHEIDQQMRD